ncbi:C40 family peptidase [Caulobacter sp. KR2-114]|uniref:C40 family peptidase n=1 Tax=Caulobacter sp. KR2-114 TaxID=3400912 RepID=UPI003BFD2671
MSEAAVLDPRITLARADLARTELEGVVKAERFAPAVVRRITVPAAAIRKAPDPAAEQLDQALFGELFDVVETAGGQAWGQARRDGYVGYVAEGALGDLGEPATHWVSALRTFAFAEPSIRAPAFGPLSMNALVTVDGEPEGGFVHALGAGWIARRHLRPIGDAPTDFVEIAEQFLGAPYLWGGRDSLGLDCSGLIQQALYACGRSCPRDTDQQAGMGRDAPGNALIRGDLVFWKGHVGVMLDGARLLHANAHHMAVAVEPLGEAIQRIAAAGVGQPLGFRRL